MSHDESRLFVLSAFAQTLSYSARVMRYALTGRLTNQRVDAVLDEWSRGLFNLGDIDLFVHGIENVSPGQESYVLMSNHASLADVPTIVRSFPARVRFVGKSDLEKVPIFGPAIRQAGNVIIDRNDRAKAIEQLKTAKAVLDAGTSLWIAPEGTRSKDGELGPLKKGGFHVAVDLQAPIAPIWLTGTRDILQTKSMKGRRGLTVRAVYGPPIPTVGLGKSDIDDLIATTRSALLVLKARAEHMEEVAG